jgi:hypothetical protein
MKKIVSSLAVAGLALGILVVRAGSETKPVNAFDRMKTLVGTWTANGPDGKPFTNTVRLVSNDTAIEEEFQGDKHGQMVTLYTADGDRLALTHYCSIGNQPHMETPAVSAGSADFPFTFVSATNLASNDDMHMSQMTLKIDDAEHFSETWTMHMGGKDQNQIFRFTRQK